MSDKTKSLCRLQVVTTSQQARLITMASENTKKGKGVPTSSNQGLLSLNEGTIECVGTFSHIWDLLSLAAVCRGIYELTKGMPVAVGDEKTSKVTFSMHQLFVSGAANHYTIKSMTVWLYDPSCDDPPECSLGNLVGPSPDHITVLQIYRGLWISDWKKIADVLPSLESLTVTSFEASGLDPVSLGKCQCLAKLKVTGCMPPFTNLPPSLTDLSLTNCRDADLGFLKESPIEQLHLRYNLHLNDVSGLAALATSLKVLYLDTLNPSVDLPSVLPSLSNLRDLEITWSETPDVFGGDWCGRLQRLVLSGADLVKVPDLSGCLALKTLLVIGDPLKDCTSLASCLGLTTVSLAGCALDMAQCDWTKFHLMVVPPSIRYHI